MSSHGKYREHVRGWNKQRKVQIIIMTLTVDAPDMGSVEIFYELQLKKLIQPDPTAWGEEQQ